MEMLHSAMVVCMLLGLVLVPTLCTAQFATAMFSVHVRDRIREKQVLYTIWVVISVVFTGGLIYADSMVVDRTAAREPTWKIVAAVETGIFLYNTEYGSLPAGSTNAQIIKILSGSNKGNKMYLYLEPEDINEHGEVIDAWGTPLRISRLDAKHSQVQSAGPDKSFDSADDIYSEDTVR